MDHSAGFVRIVDAARKRIRETDVRGVKDMMDRREQFILVDVREESEWAASRLPGAIHLSKGIIERDIEIRIPDQRARIVLYCGGGYRSALAADNLRIMGYNDVWSMDGGYRGWVEAGLPTDDG